jgi:hypothetical protein
MDLSRVIDDIALPHFIRSLPDRFDATAINETQDILEKIGWPAAPRVTEEPMEFATFQKFRKFFVGGTDIRQGIKRLDLKVAKELENLKGLGPVYKRSEQYASIENELESLSRYFESEPVEIPDIKVDEVWELVGDIFRNSKLTPFAHIIRKWEKKYGLGPFWGDPQSKKWRKLSRAKFIRSIGGIPAFIRLWARTFEVSPGLVPVAPVSVKGEALPEKKWLADIVRTVIGSPVAHYVSSTIWNYFPNHNFKFWTTNIKIGMPLNGINLAKLVLEHSAYENHFAGDFTGFDATVQDKVSKIVAKVRKKGFERHRDYAKICFLIDANYHNLLRMPMMTTSTGNIYQKNTGLSTGHSSTSLDNSLAVTIYYLCCWKKLTGLSAHEFRHYCKLSNYGDDHILSWLQTAPPAWNPANIMKMMNSFGVGLRDEEPSHDLMRMGFLSKSWRLPTSLDMAELALAGVITPAIIVFHDPKKLAGKAYAPSRDEKMDRNYRIKRLVSYLDLCAHHKDLFDKIRYDIDLIRVTKKGNVMPSPVPIPTYDEVLRKWYDPESHVHEEDEPRDMRGDVIDYSMSGVADFVVNALSLIPDVVNPQIFNMGYTNYLLSLFAKHLTWPAELIRRSNSVLTTSQLVTILKRTKYDFLADSPSVIGLPCDDEDGTLLVRHWIYNLLTPPRAKTPSSQLLSWIDNKLISLNFLINGHLPTVVRRFDIPFLEMVLIAGLSYSPQFRLPTFIQYIRVPTLSSIVDTVISTLIANVWASVPANMKQASHAISELSPETNCVLVEAPTGTGKSTTFVAFTWTNHGHFYKRVIVVVPRHLLVTTLTPYLRSAFNLPAWEVTEGFEYMDSMRLIVTTPQEVMLHPVWFTEGCLFMIDEAHVQEAPALALQIALSKIRAPTIKMTATVTPELVESCSIHVPLTIANVWQVDTISQTTIDATGLAFNGIWAAYRSKVLDILRAYPLLKFLVFVVDTAHAEWLSSRSNVRTCILSSNHKYVDPDARLFVATAVADVGITIPNVDWVITSNIGRQANPRGILPSVELVELGPEVMTQRRGRTGRTGNGLFTPIIFTGVDKIVVKPAKWDDTKIGVSLLDSGVTPTFVAQFFPGAITALWGKPYDRSSDKKIDEFTKQLLELRTGLEASHQRSFKYAEDGGGYSNLWTIQGNTIPTALEPEIEGGVRVARAITSEQMTRFLIGAAAWIVDHGTTLAADKFALYTRNEKLSGKNFIKRWGVDGFNTSDFAYGDTDPTWRYGSRNPPKPADVVPEVNGALPYFDKPIKHLFSIPDFKPKGGTASTSASTSTAPKRRPGFSAMV